MYQKDDAKVSAPRPPELEEEPNSVTHGGRPGSIRRSSAAVRAESAWPFT